MKILFLKKDLAIAVLMLLAINSWAGAFYESFAYPTGSLVGSVNTNSTAGNQTWGQNTAAGTDNKIVAGSLSYTGLPASIENSVTVTNTNAKTTRIGVGGLTLGTTDTIYYSFKVRVNDIAISAANGTSGSFVAGFDALAPTSTAVVANAVAKFQICTNGSTTQFRFGIRGDVAAATGTATLAYDATQRDVGTTYFIVGSYKKNSGSAVDDVSSIWINPTIGFFSGAGAANATSTGGDLAGGGTISSFFLRANTAATKAIQYDDIRISKSWEYCMGAPAFETNPTNDTKNATSNVTFTASTVSSVHSSVATIGYRWLKGGVPLTDGGNVSGAGTAALTLTGVLAADAGSYSLIASNNPYTPSMSITSAVATLTVINDPGIITQPSPASQQVTPGSTVNYTVAAVGTPTLTYQWYKDASPLSDGGIIAGASTSALSLTGVSVADSGTYTCAVTNGVPNGVVSSGAALTIVDPAITTPPVSLIRTNGDTATFSIVAAGTTPFTYKWRKNGTEMSDTGNASGTSSDTLTLTTVSYTDIASYDCIATNNLGNSVTSTVATLTVRDPFITVQPTSQTNCAGTTANFSVTASGTPTLYYQWYKGAAELAGKTDASLSLPTVSQTDAANYYVVVTNASTQSRTSSVVSLTVTDPPAITTGPSDRTVLSGVNVGFVVAASGTGPLSYQWSTNSVPIAGATGTSVIISNVVAGTYTVSVNVTNATLTTACGSATASATLNVVSSLSLNQGNLVVARVGNGAQTLRDAGNSIYLDQFNTSGTYVNTVTIPDSGGDAIIARGTAGDAIGGLNGMTTLTTSSNGGLLVLNGIRNSYDPAATVVAGGTSDNSQRAVTTINLHAQYQLRISATTNNTGNSAYRSSAFDGEHESWGGLGSTTAGVYYFGTDVAAGGIALDNVRIVGFFNGNFYAMRGNAGLFRYNGAPHPGDTFTQDIPVAATGGTPNGPGACDYAVSPDGNTIYIADGRNYASGTPATTIGGIQKWEKVLGSFGTVPTRILKPDPNSNLGSLYMTADFSGANPVIYAVTIGASTNKLVKVVDDGSNSGAGTATLLATAGPNQQFRGIRFSPICAAPTISVQPTNTFPCDGSTANFSVTAGGGLGTLTYQWTKDGTPIAGETTASLSLPTVSASDEASYRVEITSSCGASVTSSPPATLTINRTPTANAAPYTGYLGVSLKIVNTNLVTYASDLDNDVLTVYSVSNSTNGVSVTKDAEYVYYNATLTADDRFAYVVTDPCGNRATNQVYITALAAPPVPSPALVVAPAGNATVTFYGIPYAGYNYQVERATNVLFTLGVSNFPAGPAAGNGAVQIIDDFSDIGGPPSSAYYRMRYVP